MTMNNTENNGSRKKYLVPLVVLLLCGVAMTGAAYAYNSTMNASGNATVDSYEITLDGDTANTITHTFSALQFNSVVGATTAYTIDSTNAAQTITVNAINAKGAFSGFTIDSMPTVTLKDQDNNAITKIKCTVTCTDSTTAAASHILTFTFALNDVDSLAASDIPTSITATFAIATTAVNSSA